MQKTSVFVCLLIVLVVKHVKPNTLHLPLKIPPRVTASFMEYRGGHFHGGIDFSTQQITGHPVYSLDSGIVYRIKNVDRGEGRALYLKHSNGYISVYAHLEDFADKIKKLVPEAKIFDIYPETRVEVKKGEHVAYSGESGAGLPHLHVEYRDTENHPTPLVMSEFGLTDKVPPTLTKIRIVPYLASGEEHVLLPRDLNKPVEIANGPVAIQVEGYDSFGSDPGKCGLAKIKLVLLKDEQETILYEADFNHIDFSDRVPTAQHFDRLRTNLSPTFYTYKLYRDSIWKSKYVKNLREEGALGVGTHNLEIRAWDYQNNMASLSLSLLVQSGTVDRPKPYKGPLRFDSGRFILELAQNSPSHQTSVSLNKVDTKDLTNHDLIDGVSFTPSYIWLKSVARLRYSSELMGKEYFVRRNHHNGTWSASGTQRHGNELSTSVSGPGEYGIKLDHRPPVIEGQRLVIKGLRLTRVMIRIYDRDSGLDRSSIRLQCNTKNMVVEWDPDRSALEIPAGCGLALIRACDQVQNCTERELELRH